ncbi:MAG TPA: glutamate formimidoyltransferase [Candidatus Acidoferrum sp.]|nr:glutamate formimidoyltransferase [Candidatus Acidoferrum sp.]
MNRLIECVPNFSEGRDLRKIDAIVEAMSGVAGAWILDRTSDADHNRTVVTLAGEPEGVAEAAIRGAGKAAELIDMTRQTGVHPRIGATDVIPFVPLEGVTMNDCVTLARHVGQELWKRYRVPVYFYEAAATRPDRVNLENIRKGQFEGLRADVLHDPNRSPDIGEPRLHLSAGATVVGARKILIAYNIYLNTTDISVAREIARTIRSSSGGLRHVKAIGVEMKTRGLTQVSINLTDFEQTPLHRVFESVKLEAERRACEVVGSEIIGLVPRKAVELSAEDYLLLENFSPGQVLENRLAAVAGILPSTPTLPAVSRTALQPLVDTLREAVQQFSGRTLSASQEALSGSQITAERRPERTAESHLEAAFAATEIYERLVQLEAMAAPSMLLDWLTVKQAAVAAARGALESAEALLPSLRDAGMVERIKSATAEIEAKLIGKPVTTGK